jgi:DNA repair exonuclease SbcCD ATPase subunit
MSTIQTETNIKVNVDTKSASKEVENLTSQINDLKTAYESATEGSQEQTDALKKLTKAEKDLEKEQSKLNKSVDENAKATKESKKSSGSFLDTLKAFSVVGAITTAFGFLKDSLMKNQKVADAVGAIFSTIDAVMNSLVEIVVNVTDKVGKSSNGFSALGKVMSGLLTLALTPIKLAFGGISLLIEEAQLAWEQSFFGDDNPETIKKLNAQIAETKKGLSETATEAIGAGKDIVNNFGEAVTSVGDVISGVVEGASKINVKSLYENAKATTALKNSAEIASAQLQGVVEEYDRQAEKLRQIRDDDSNSIQDRIKANEDLGKVLKNQESAMLGLANQKIASAKAELSANSSSIELQKKVIEAENERKGILAQITGLQSEQKANAVALNKELIAMNKALADSEHQLMIDRQTANAELMKNELAKNQELQRLRDEERVNELARLQSQIDATKEGTQARVDAQIAYNAKKQELDIADAKSQEERNAIIKQREADTAKQKSDNLVSQHALEKQLIDADLLNAYDKSAKLIEIARTETAEQLIELQKQRDAEIADAEAKGLSTTEIRQKYAIKAQTINNALAKSEKDLAKARIQANQDAGIAIADSLNGLAQLFGENTALGKAMAVASTTISTIVSAQKAYESAQQLPFGLGAIIGPINAGLAIASGVKSVKNILAVKIPNTGGGGSGSAGSMPNVSIPSAPPLPPTMGSTMINQEQVNAMGNSTARAYVVESDVTGSQERIERLNRASRIN